MQQPHTRRPLNSHAYPLGVALLLATCAAGCSLTPRTPLPCSNPKQRAWKRQKKQMYLELFLLHTFFQPQTILLGNFLTLFNCICWLPDLFPLPAWWQGWMAAVHRATSSCTL